MVIEDSHPSRGFYCAVLKGGLGCGLGIRHYGLNLSQRPRW
jgi:hypothetical protein